MRTWRLEPCESRLFAVVKRLVVISVGIACVGHINVGDGHVGMVLLGG